MEEYLINEPCKKDEKTKQKFTDALQLCLDLLNENNNIYRNNIEYSSNNILTRKSAIIGHEMYEFFKETINNLTIKEEIIEPHTEKIKLKRVSVKLERLDPDVIKNLTEKKNKNVSIVNDNDGVKNVETQNKPKTFKKPKNVYISQKKKLEIINLIRKHPTWTMRMIKEKSNYYSCQLPQVKQWIAKFKKGGSHSKLMNIINRHVYGKYIKFKRQNKNITDEDLTKWAGDAIEKYNISYSKHFELQINWLEQDNKRHRTSFVAGDCWIHYFKKKYNIKGRNARELQIVDKMKINKTFDHRFKPLGIPFETKLKIVNTVRENPDWTPDMIKKHCKYNKNLDRQTIREWTEQVKRGGSYVDKMKKIHDWIYQKCIDYRKNYNQLSYKNIREFGRQAYEIYFPDKKNRIPFTASEGWIYKFKNSFGIVGRSPNLIITNKLTNDEISDTTEAPNEESPVAQDESDDDSSVESNDKKSRVTYDDKIKVIKLARENPTWTIAMLRQVSGVKCLKGITTLDLWKKEVKNGGNKRDKSYRLNQWLDNKVNEYKSKNKKLTREIIQGFLDEAEKSLKIKNLITPKGRTWWCKFRKRHNLDINCHVPKSKVNK
ncbi:hypothetical protein HCN44_001606 [Aphidius gifuensis]|uniref:HTH CENPB-type domain-containing protein n=1 Tax=Aphidius gifuensis TaxID=684658 RepID=A0A834XWW4_APHGI|nr:hypothetical protein HCN44_001606 [Aphidius gifuensis]